MSRLSVPKTCGRCDQLITTTEELDRHDLRHMSPAALGATTGGNRAEGASRERLLRVGNTDGTEGLVPPAGGNILPFQPRFDISIPADNGDRRPICVACLHSAGSVLRRGEAYCGACALMWGPYDLTDAFEDWHESHLRDQEARR